VCVCVYIYIYVYKFVLKKCMTVSTKIKNKAATIFEIDNKKWSKQISLTQAFEW